MTQREKRLGVAVLLLVVGYGGWLLWGRWRDAAERRQNDYDAARVAVADAQLRESRALAASRRLAGLRARSLPADAEAAQAAYRSWLIDRVADAGLSLEDIRRVGPPMDRAGAYTLLQSKLQADGDFAAVAKFLHSFYSSSATHKLTQLKLTPTDREGQLRVDADIEAIIVSGTRRRAGLPEEASDRLALESADAYVESIAGRNLFVAYKPPPRVEKRKPRPVAKKPPRSDDSKQAYFTAAVGTAGRLQAWIVVRSTGESLRVSAGDDLEVGLLKGRVLDVEARHLTIELGEKRLRVPLGKSLRDGVSVSAADTPAPAGAGPASGGGPLRGGNRGRVG